jgi:hypothetical protein
MLRTRANKPGNCNRVCWIIWMNSCIENGHRVAIKTQELFLQLQWDPAHKPYNSFCLFR